MTYGMRTARLPLCQRGNLDLRPVEIRVVRKQHVGASLGDDVTEARGGGGVGLKARLVGPEVERRAAPGRRDVRCPLSNTGTIVDTVPGVCPGVMYIVSVVSPSVSF